jgi:hypothetical protein
MDWDKHSQLRSRLHKLAPGLPEHLINALIQLEEEDLPVDDLELLLVIEAIQAFSGDDQSRSGGSCAFVSVPIKPRPHPGSGAIALPGPDDPDH